MIIENAEYKSTESINRDIQLSKSIVINGCLTSVFARLINSRTYRINKLFEEHSIEVRSAKIKVIRKNTTDDFSKIEKMNYFLWEDLALVIDKIKQMKIDNFRSIQFIYNIIKASYIIRNYSSDYTNLYNTKTYKLKYEAIDSDRASRLLNICKRSLHKNKKLNPIFIDDTKYYFKQRDLIRYINEKNTLSKTKKNALLLIDMLINDYKLSTKEIYYSANLESKISYVKYISQIYNEYKISDKNAKKIIDRYGYLAKRNKDNETFLLTDCICISDLERVSKIRNIGRYYMDDCKIRIGKLTFINKYELIEVHRQFLPYCVDCSEYYPSTELSRYIEKHPDYLSHMRLRDNKPIEYIKIQKYTMVKLTKKFIEHLKNGLSPTVVNLSYENKNELDEIRNKNNIIDFYGIDIQFKDIFDEPFECKSERRLAFLIEKTFELEYLTDNIEDELLNTYWKEFYSMLSYFKVKNRFFNDMHKLYMQGYIESQEKFTINNIEYSSWKVKKVA